MFSAFFINRPIFATVISIVIVLIGAITFPLLPIEKTPDITPPTVVVTARYPGASADVIAETVATPLEEQINGIEGMLYMSSQSSDDGTMTLTVTFKVGVDVDMATVLVQNRVAMAEPLLPEEVRRYGVTTQKQSTNITLAISLQSPDGRYDATYMSNYINIYLKDTLSRVPGVGNVRVFGAKDFSMRIWLDPELLKARGLTTTDVLNTLREQNVQVSAGQIGAPPMKKGEPFQYTVKTLGRLSSVEQFKNIVLRAADDGRVLYLKDVARVELGSELYGSFVEFNGVPSVAMGIFQLPGANSLEIAKNIQAAMQELSKSFPPGLIYQIPFDPTRFISESIKEIFLTLLTVACLVILVVYFFLEDWRAMLVPAVAIPVSLIGTFSVMLLLGMSINTLTMFGLVLAIGIVVDDAIVVVENCARIIDEEKLPSKEAAVKAMKQITGPVVATTLVLLTVFVPAGLIGGISGRLYSQFAITISVATVISALVALTLSPAMCALFLRPSFKHRGLIGLFDRLVKRMTAGYTNTVERLTRKVAVAMVGFVVLLVLTGLGIKVLPTGFLPNEDEGYFLINVELPPGAGVDRTREVTNQINEILKQTPGIHEYVAIGGISLVNGVLSSNSAGYFVMLKPWQERRSKSQSVEAITGQINRQLFGILNARCFAFQMPPVRGLGRTAGFEVKVQDRGHAGLAELQNVGDRLVFAANSDPTLMQVNSDFRANVPQLYLDIDRTKVKRLGISLSDVFTTLQANLGTAYVNDLNLFGRTYKVMMQADEQYRSKAEDILKLQVRNNNGDMIPLRTFVKVSDIAGPQAVFHYNLYPCTTIRGSAAPGFSSGQAIAAMRKVLDQNLPSSMSYEWSGMSYQEILAGHKAPIIFALASIFAFLFLAAQYESWSAPIAIVLSVPLALVGAIGFTLFRGLDNNIYTQIGIILLIGLSCKTAILMVEFAKQHQEEGYSAADSALAAARLRFRPILMTVLTDLFGVAPLVFAMGAGAVSRRALGTAVFGGMAVATVLGLFMIPIFYIAVQWVKAKACKIEKTVEDKIIHHNEQQK